MPLPILKTIITVSDFGLLSYLLSLMMEQFQNNYSLKSWSTIFHVQCVIWLTLRGCFWFGTIITTNVSSELYLKILYWLPCPFEYGAFLTIPLFFAQVIYPSESRAVVPYVFPFFAGLIVALIIVMVMWVWYTVTNYTPAQMADCRYVNDDDSVNNCSHLADSSIIFRIITAITYIVLAAFQALYSVKLYYLDEQHMMRFMISSPKLIGVLNIILFVSFSSRGVYQILAMFDIFQLPSIPLLGSQDLSISDVICFEMWYIIPTILLITTLTGKSIRRSDGSSSVEIMIGYRTSDFEEDWQNMGSNASRGGKYGSIEDGSNQEENIHLTGLSRFETPVSLVPTSPYLVVMSGSIFEDKTPLIQTPPESSLLIPIPNMERNAAEQDYRRQKIESANKQRISSSTDLRILVEKDSRSQKVGSPGRARGSSFGNVRGLVENDGVEDTNLRLSSSYKSRGLLAPGSGSMFLRGVDAMEFRCFTPDDELQQKSRQASNDGGYTEILRSPGPLVTISPHRSQTTWQKETIGAKTIMTNMVEVTLPINEPLEHGTATATATRPDKSRKMPPKKRDSEDYL